MRYLYLTCCVESTAERIDAMKDRAREITRESFCRHVPAAAQASVWPHYTWGPGRKEGLRMKDDWHVAYYKSIYDSQPCLFAVHSAIEYIFVPRRERADAA